MRTELDEAKARENTALERERRLLAQVDNLEKTLANRTNELRTVEAVVVKTEAVVRLALMPPLVAAACLHVAVRCSSTCCGLTLVS